MFNNKPERKGKPLINYSFPLRLMFSTIKIVILETKAGLIKKIKPSCQKTK